MNRGRFVRGLRSDIQFTERDQKRIIQRSIDRDGWKLKCTITIEELAELQQQVTKQIRGFGDKIGLLEEMADVYICLNFLESIFNIKSEDIRKAIDVKLAREKERERSSR